MAAEGTRRFEDLYNGTNGPDLATILEAASDRVRPVTPVVPAASARPKELMDPNSLGAIAEITSNPFLPPPLLLLPSVVLRTCRVV